MLIFENIEVYGWEAAVRGMRNPMNSWHLSDSGFVDRNGAMIFEIGPSDLKLMRQLVAAGTDHSKFRRMIQVSVDITGPLYWWKEFDTYKVGTVANSCSTMHKIHDRKFTRNDFSCDYLDDPETGWGEIYKSSLLDSVIYALNEAREKYLETKDKRYWYQMIQLLPSSYNQKRTVMLSYEVLANMHNGRHSHKLDEWRGFCGVFVEPLPYAFLINPLIRSK